MKRSLLIYFVLMCAIVAPVSAQSGYTNGDRVFAYCNPNNIEIYGIAPDETGFSLAVFTYTTLYARGPGQISAQTPMGQVVLSYDLQGNFRVQWFGGPYFATGSDSFTKAFTCPMPTFVAVPIPVPPPSAVPTPPPQQNVLAQQTITYNGTTISQTVTITTGTSQTCARGSHYVVRRGDTLFRISRRCGVSIDALVQANHIRNRNLIYVGQVLIIP